MAASLRRLGRWRGRETMPTLVVIEGQTFGDPVDGWAALLSAPSARARYLDQITIVIGGL